MAKITSYGQLHGRILVGLPSVFGHNHDMLLITYHISFQLYPMVSPHRIPIFFQFYIFNCSQHAHRLGGKSTSLSTNPSKISRWLHSVVASYHTPAACQKVEVSLWISQEYLEASKDRCWLYNPRLPVTPGPHSIAENCLGIYGMIHSPCGKL